MLHPYEESPKTVYSRMFDALKVYAAEDWRALAPTDELTNAFAGGANLTSKSKEGVSCVRVFLLASFGRIQRVRLSMLFGFSFRNGWGLRLIPSFKKSNPCGCSSHNNKHIDISVRVCPPGYSLTSDQPK